MDPLIWWAVEFAERFSTDCLAALDWYHHNQARIAVTSTIGHNPKAAAAWLRSLPEHPRLDSRPMRDMAYLAAISPGLPGRSIWSGLNQLRRTLGAAGIPPSADAGAPKPLPVPSTARINDRPWLELDWRHVAHRGGRHRACTLWYALQGACAVVIGYLGAGPRPLELRSLRRGCLRVRHLDGGAVRYHIEGRILKRQRDLDDQQSLDGIEHIWPVLPQAARAVEVLDHLPGPDRSNILFSDPQGCPLDAAGVNRAIRAFFDLANQLAAHHQLPTIADDLPG